MKNRNCAQLEFTFQLKLAEGVEINQVEEREQCMPREKNQDTSMSLSAMKASSLLKRYSRYFSKLLSFNEGTKNGEHVG